MDILEFSINNPITEEQIEVLQRIRRNIRRSENEYALYFVECNLPNLRRQLIGELDNTDNLNLLTLDIADYPKNEGIHIDEWVHKQKNKYQKAKSKQSLDAINITGLEQLLPTGSDEQIIKTVSELNWRRSYFQALKVPIIFWLPSYALELLATQASDFYDWYSDIYHFESDLKQKQFAVSQQTNSLRHPKTNIAAYQYQSKEEKEKQIRQLNALLDETRSTNDNAHIKNQMGLLLISMSELDRALNYFQAAQKDYKVMNNQTMIGTIQNNIAHIYHVQGDYSKALDYLQSSLTIHREMNNRAELSTALNNLSQLYNTCGDYNKSLEALEQSLVIREEINDISGKGTVLNNISQIYYYHGKFDLALDYLKKSLSIHEKINNKSGFAAALNNISQIHIKLNDYSSASEMLEKSLTISKDIGDKEGIGTTLNNLAVLHYTCGDYDRALECLSSSLIIREEIGDVSATGTILNNISQIHHDNKNFEKALEYLNRALLLYEKSGYKEGIGIVLNNIFQKCACKK